MVVYVLGDRVRMVGGLYKGRTGTFKCFNGRTMATITLDGGAFDRGGDARVRLTSISVLVVSHGVGSIKEKAVSSTGAGTTTEGGVGSSTTTEATTNKRENKNDEDEINKIDTLVNDMSELKITISEMSNKVEQLINLLEIEKTSHKKK